VRANGRTGRESTRFRPKSTNARNVAAVGVGDGFALFRHGQPHRIVGVVAEFYDGPSPYGQFVLESTQHVGGGFQVQR
jgi:hypothetical protein